MSTGRPPHSVPTLTEVVDWPPPDAAQPAQNVQPARDAPPADLDTTGQGPAPASEAARASGAGQEAHPAPAPDATSAASFQVPAAGHPMTPFDAGEVEQRVLADVQRQLELMLEVRLREALTPLLARTADAMVRDTRNELSATLREIVGRAVAQELARRRGS